MGFTIGDRTCFGAIAGFAVLFVLLGLATINIRNRKFVA